MSHLLYNTPEMDVWKNLICMDVFFSFFFSNCHFQSDLSPFSAPRQLCIYLQVFQTLHATGQSSMVRDWVLLSLSNFTQRTPVAMAMWSLSCFFVSASTSQWISALYPYMLTVKGQ